MPELLDRLAYGRADRMLHVHETSARPATVRDWPGWLPVPIVTAYRDAGISAPWSHQVEAAEAAFAGEHVVVATGTASGKSLAFGMPALTRILEGTEAPDGRGATVLYLSPTKALARDQLRALSDLGLPWLRAATYDGDTPSDERQWVRQHASLVLTNPDLLHFSLLPGHETWARFLRRLRLIVVDEAHAYRGVTGAHVAAVVRRLRRVAAHHGANPVVFLASATMAQPEVSAERLIGAPVRAVTDDGSPRPGSALAFWEPPLVTTPSGEVVRRSTLMETADLLADCVVEGRQALAFVRSRRAAETVALAVQDQLADVDPALVSGVAAYRGGYLPEERRALERSLREGTIRALATTNALELGIDVSGLDAVLVAGWPGTRASLWQQLGRAGRAGVDAVGVFVARDDPLDGFLVHHPTAVVDQPVEASVFDPGNPYVLAPHLCAAAAELPLTEVALAEWFPASARATVAELARIGMLRARPTGWFWTRQERASDLTDLRGSGGSAVRVVEAHTGRLLGTVDRSSAPGTVHPGAVYVHQGITHVVGSLDLDDSVAMVEVQEVDYSTTARSISDIQIREEVESSHDGVLHRGTVEVTSQVVSFLRRRPTGEIVGTEDLDLPPQTLTTQAVWWTVDADALARSGIEPSDIPGAAHAAEHAAIGLLPLFATCDRWDLGGVSTAAHPDTGCPTVFVYDGYPGGAGFTDHGFRVAAEWLGATRAVIAECGCTAGCPACVQSPKCGNGNEPLDKAGAVQFLDTVLSLIAARPAHARSGTRPESPAASGALTAPPTPEG